jgi:mono/diheme cytochrome c family protein
MPFLAALPIRHRTLAVLATTITLACALHGDEKKPDLTKLPPAAKDSVDFARDVQPILARSCLSCHGASKQKGGFRLDLGAEAKKGGNSGTAWKAGDSVHSRLILAVSGLDSELKMPPKGDLLTAAEVSKLRRWIDDGANWPEDKTSVATTRTESTHWAFQPIRQPKLPAVKNAAWVRNGIDAFILARLEKENIAPSAEADRTTLIRRVSLDLLGLLPTPAEVDAFVNDTRADAYDRLVDRLLASPHYGERWGRHWLDSARYADSDGYEKDTGRPFAWRYRQWVIEAMNRDLTFDKFLTEQLAGDLLPNATTEQKVATGFHRNTLTNREGGVDQEQFRVEAVVDRVNTTARVFLGITLNCAQCHDHKYDPFSQREFYQFLAFFNRDVERDLPASLPGQAEVEQKKKAEYDRQTAELQAAVAAAKKDGASRQKQWEADLKLAELRKLPAELATALLLEPAKRNQKQQQQVAAQFAKVDPVLAKATKELTTHQRATPPITMAQTLALGSDRKTHVMIRGDFLRKGVEVEPNTPGVLSALTLEKKAGLGTRLDLAHWLTAPSHPLTSRVLANWAWHKYFGRGLVVTLEDFGTQGERPSHPELLDWLASEWMQQKWSLKALHRLIVTSATYRQSSKSRPELWVRDPLNVLLARQHRGRLEAEIIRDVSLAASGLLNAHVGGPSVRPPQPAGISELTYAGSARWVESTGPDRYRRGMYTWFQRTSPYPMLLTFDAPDSNVCCVRRERSNTPLQALTLLNDTVFFECAQALGRRLLTDKPAQGTSADVTAERIRHAFRLCLAREPSAAELKRLAELQARLLEKSRANPEAAAKLAGKNLPKGMEVSETAAWVALARAIMNLDEFVTRE